MQSNELQLLLLKYSMLSNYFGLQPIKTKVIKTKVYLYFEMYSS